MASIYVLPAICLSGLIWYLLYDAVRSYTAAYRPMIAYLLNNEVAGSRPDEVNAFFFIFLILPAALGPGVYSTSNRNEYQKH
jgi:hypothetical protein